MKKEVEAIVEVKPEQDLKSIPVINDILVSKTGIVEENEVENTNLQKHSHQLVKQDSDAKHFKADQNGCWVRCEEPWSDPAEGDSLCIFYEAQLRKYPCEMELEAEALFLICLLCEVQSMKTWCPFVASSEQHCGDSHDQLNCNDERYDDKCIFYRTIIHPFCTFVLGLMVLYTDDLMGLLVMRSMDWFLYSSKLCVHAENPTHSCHWFLRLLRALSHPIWMWRSV